MVGVMGAKRIKGDKINKVQDYKGPDVQPFFGVHERQDAGRKKCDIEQKSHDKMTGNKFRDS
jgi:hypothetical protein